MVQDSSLRQRTGTLVLGAIGVVFGDIGTSPLYTIREAFGPAYGLAASDANVLGVLSLVFWSLTLIVTLKYVLVVMRADNRGEGGIMSLMALAQRGLPVAASAGYVVGVLGIFGAALFFGDAVITPAISVLSAVEGLEVLAPHLQPFVVPITIAVLVGLFMLQKRGTARVGRLFGPITVVWLAAIALFGALAIADTPRVLVALSPLPALHFVGHHGGHAFFVLGAVVLAVTGAEALYADMGHFGKRPIQLGWMLVFPALVLNYFGQGALLLDHPSAAANPFYRLVPGWALVPTIMLATAATVVASQAVISGAFSLARQAMQLGYLPRMAVVHTSEHEIGQIYLPWINRALLVVVIGLVLGFKNSSALASAYGVSVTGTMLITTGILYVVVTEVWRKRGVAVDLLFAGLLAVDVTFFGANIIKFADGAWVPVALGLVVFTLMRTWRRGQQLMASARARDGLKREAFIASLRRQPPLRVGGTAIFLSADPRGVPLALRHNLKHNQVLHARNVFLTVETLPVPRCDPDERTMIDELGDGFMSVRLRFGFMEQPDVVAALTAGVVPGLDYEPMRTTFFASRESVVATRRPGMALWRERLFALMQRNATPATESFGVSGNRLVELGTQVEI